MGRLLSSFGHRRIAPRRLCGRSIPADGCTHDDRVWGACGKRKGVIRVHGGTRRHLAETDSDTQPRLSLSIHEHLKGSHG
jgi:hypothetical protein